MTGVSRLISSPSNPLLKQVRAAARRGAASPEGWAVAEGPNLLREALGRPALIETVLLSTETVSDWEAALDRDGVDFRVVEAAVFRRLAATETTQGVLTLARLPAWHWAQLFEAERPVLILDGVQDPGNAGTLVRSAEAFGAGGVVFTVGAAQPHHPKTLRASAGSLFRTPFRAKEGPARIIEACLTHDYRLLAASAHGGADIAAVDFERSAIVIGAEGRGVREEFLEIAEPIQIPTERVESLNAAAAGAVILYEASRGLRGQ